MPRATESSRLQEPVTIAPTQLKSSVRWITRSDTTALPKKRTVKVLSQWFAANEDVLLKTAEADCLRIAKKPTL